MYGFPRDFDAEVLVGRELSSVTFAENLISLQWDEIVSVTILGSISYRVGLGTEEHTDSPPVSESRLVALVGRSVVASRIESPRRLVLLLEHAGSITLLDDSDAYESYIIQIGDRQIVV
jgi:hypothetical protein